MAQKCRYLALSERYLPDRGGHIVWLHEAFRRIGEARILAATRPDRPREEVIDGVTLRRIAMPRWPLVRPESLPLYANLILQAAREVLASRPGVIVAARILPEGLVANLVGRVLRVPSVVFAHGEEINRMRRGKALRDRRQRTARAKREFLWGCFARADAVIANSRFTRDLLAAGGVDPRRVTVIHPGTDPEQFRPGPKDAELVRRLQLTGKKVILTVGRLRVRKGQDMTLRAMPAILKEVPEAVYVIAGIGPYEQELQALVAELGVEAHVRFLMSVPPETLPATYNLADVFVMPNRVTAQSSDVEGFGIVFLEASASGVPVIGGKTGGVPDAIADGETGLLVDGDSPDAIARAILRVLKDPPLARRLGQNGRDRVCRQLTWDHSAKRIERLLTELAARRRR